MFELLVLGLIAFGGLLALGLGVLFLLKLAVMLVFWPLKIVLRLLLLPLVIVGFALKLVLGLLLLPVMGLAVALGLVAAVTVAALVLLVPLFPILVVAFLVWLWVRNSRRTLTPVT